MRPGTRTVLIAGDRDLLREGVRLMLCEAARDGELKDVTIGSGTLADGVQLRAAARRYRGEGPVVVLLLDPVGEGWLQAADELRADRNIAIIVLAARPNYALQRTWRRQARPSGERRCSGMLALNSPASDLVRAIRAATDNPSEIGFWLRRDIGDHAIAQHPNAFLRHETSEGVQEVLRKGLLHQTLVVASELSDRDARRALSVEQGTYRGRLNQLQQALGVSSDVALGRRAADLGLFTDDGLEWSQQPN